MPEQMGGELIKRWVEGRAPERLPIVLHFGPYAARLQRLSYQRMCEDATLLANALQSAARLFDCDGLILLADPTIEAEACGCEIEWRDDEPVVVSHPLGGTAYLRGGEDGPSCAAPRAGVDLGGIEGRGRLAVLLEAARRLVAVIGGDLALMPAITGPVTLASHLSGPAFWNLLQETPEQAYRVLNTAAQVALVVGRVYLDLGCRQLVVSDGKIGEVDPAHFPAIASALRPLGKVCEFYDAHLLVHSEVDDVGRLGDLAGLGVDGLLLEGGVHLDPTAPGVGRPGLVDQPLGLGVPLHLFGRAPSDVEGMLAAWCAEACSAGTLAMCFTIPRWAPPESVGTIVRVLRAAATAR